MEADALVSFPFSCGSVWGHCAGLSARGSHPTWNILYMCNRLFPGEWEITLSSCCTVGCSLLISHKTAKFRKRRNILDRNETVTVHLAISPYLTFTDGSVELSVWSWTLLVTNATLGPALAGDEMLIKGGFGNTFAEYLRNQTWTLYWIGQGFLWETFCWWTLFWYYYVLTYFNSLCFCWK